MDNNLVQLVGAPCGQHGPYTFYKAFKYTKNGQKRIVKLSEFFFVKLWTDSDLVCIGELQLLWIDKNSEQVLSSLRLYFLPENTPEGRMDHGEDEVLAISEKVVLRLEDLVTWITVDAEWTWGRLAKCEADIKEPQTNDDGIASKTVLRENCLDYTDIEKEKKLLDTNYDKTPSVVILSYPSYCRYRAIMKRLDGVEAAYLKQMVVKVLGGFASANRNTRVLFCRDTFDYPELEGHELLCNHLAPKLKGRPRGRRKKRSISPGSESNESESSVSNVFNNAKNKIMTEGGLNGTLRRSTRSVGTNSEAAKFMKELYTFMKSINSPIERIPSLGHKELDLNGLFTKVHKLGGYEVVTNNRLWKSVFIGLSGNYISTSAATVLRRHYERFLLPYEKHLKGDEYKLKATALKRTKSNSSSGSDFDTSDATSASGNTTPPFLHPSQTNEQKEFNLSDKVKSEMIKTSSLRSVRVKSDRTTKDTTAKTSNSKCENGDAPKKIERVKEATPPDASAKTKTNSVNSNNAVKTEASAPKSQQVTKQQQQQPIIAAAAPISVIESNPHVKGAEPADATATAAPACNSGQSGAIIVENSHASDDDDRLEVPFKPEVADAALPQPQSDVVAVCARATTPPDKPLLHNVKKRKLDILKEGGLEVTPVQTISSSPEPMPSTENRPSVIHQPVVRHLAAHADKPTPPPPPPLIKTPTPITCESFLYGKEQSPPKVMQSRSIYSYSEKIVYGNPKDYFTPPMKHPHAPKSTNDHAHQTLKHGGELLDLTLKSPQKPVVEIMRVPSAQPLMLTSRDKPVGGAYKSAALPSRLDARVGSNLEITLVSPHAQQAPTAATPIHKYANHYAHAHTDLRHAGAHFNSHAPPTAVNQGKGGGHKRTLSGNLAHKRDGGANEHALYHREHVNKQLVGTDVNMASVYGGRMMEAASKGQSKSTTPKSYPASAPTIPGYLSHLSLASKMMPQYMNAAQVDPLYYSALQNLYPPGGLSAVPPFFSLASPDQLQYYSDLMARSNQQMRFPFQYGGQDALANIDSSNVKR